MKKHFKAFQFINIIMLALVMAVFWGSWFGLSRSIATLSPEVFLETGKAFIANLAPTMPIIFPVALLSTFPVLYLLYRYKSQKALTLTAIGFFLFLVALVITLSVNVPIDNQIKLWTVDTLPSNWEALRDRWELYHTLRSFASLLGLGFIVAGTLVNQAVINKEQ